VAGGVAPEVALAAAANAPRLVRLVHTVAVAVADLVGVNNAQVGTAQLAVFRLVHSGAAVDFTVAEALLGHARAVTAGQAMRPTN